MVRSTKADKARQLNAAHRLLKRNTELAEAAQKSLKVKFGETTSDGATTLEAVYCLGLCATAPAILVDERPVGRMTPKKFKALVQELAS